MTYWWPTEAYEKLPIRVQKARELLEDWFRAIESGMAFQRLPDPFTKVVISQEVADRVVEHLDREFRQELSWASSAEAGSYKDSPGFARLGPLQRIALAQQLRKVLKEGDDPPLTDHRGAYL